jgi:Predicted nucleotide-binding protein containing TIR-like domain
MIKKPTIFIGSSSEGSPIAYAIQQNLEDIGDVYVWTQGVFELGNSYLESLINELDKVDFAILVLTEDDITISRGEESISPRDNVLFELGLFIGRLGKDRSFFVYDTEKNIKIPSDLSGISGAGYKIQQSTNLVASLGAACNKIRTAVSKAGLRLKMNATQINAFNRRVDFCNKITGHWWERIKPDENIALCFLTIKYDEALLILKLEGRSFNKGGDYVAFWESKSSGIRFDEQKLFYSWEGWHPSTPSSPYEGSGQIRFLETDDIYMQGNGIFSKLNISDLKTIQKSGFELSRCTQEEVNIMDSKEKEKITKLIIDKISQMF